MLLACYLEYIKGVKMERKFTLEYWIDDGWYVGRIKEVPGVFSQGADLEELEENIRDAYRMVSADQDEYTPSAEIKKKELLLQV
jgi:predicted RNase H-like HicB family nuclease